MRPARPCRSKVTSAWQRLRRRITGKRLYRCDACGWRQWDVDHGPGPDEYDVAGFQEENNRFELIDDQIEEPKLSELDLTELDLIELDLIELDHLERRHRK
jgi:hypothetical protein